MLNVIIIVLILVGLALQRYLNSFWEQDMLPYPFGFGFFIILFVLIYLVSFIWMFGVIAGLIVSVLCFSQIVNSAVLWIASLPWLINMQKKRIIPQVNRFVFVAFPYLLIATAILTVINFFVSSYKSMWNMLGDNIWPPILVFVAIIVVGNVVRFATMSKILKIGAHNK